MLFFFLLASPPCPDHALCPATPLPICLRHIPWAPDSSFSKAFTGDGLGGVIRLSGLFNSDDRCVPQPLLFKKYQTQLLQGQSFASKSRLRNLLPQLKVRLLSVFGPIPGVGVYFHAQVSRCLRFCAELRMPGARVQGWEAFVVCFDDEALPTDPPIRRGGSPAPSTAAT